MNNNSNKNLEFLDIINYMSFAMTLANYQQNLQQSDNDDIMYALDQKTSNLLKKLEDDLQQQNIMLKEILNRLENNENGSS